MTSRLGWRGWAVVVAVLAVVSAALLVADLVRADDDAVPSATSTGTGLGPGGVLTSVTVDASQRVRMTSRLRPGVHRFVVSSAQPALFQIIRLADGYEPATAAADVEAGFLQADPDVTALRRLEANATFLGGVPSSQGRQGAFWVDLPAGTYWTVDVNAPPVSADSFRRVTVAGEDTGGSLPDATTLEASPGSVWSDTPRVVPARGNLDFANLDQDNHSLAIARLRDGRTLAEVEAYFAARRRGETPADPPLREQQVVSTGVLGPGLGLTVEYDVEPGRYVVLCTWPDADAGGVPHAYTGMVRLLTVR